jgi:hypothetical protein
MSDKKIIQDIFFNNNLLISAMGLLNLNTLDANKDVAFFNGKKFRKLQPNKEQQKKFQEQFQVHPMCGCVGCMELSKLFILQNNLLKETVIEEAMNDLGAHSV